MEREKKVVKVVGAAIIEDGLVLVAQRPRCEVPYKSLKWEFPGGKVELGETDSEAIQREIHEELGCQIEVIDILPEIDHEYPDFTLRMTICICRIIGRQPPQPLEHNILRWCSTDSLPDLDWAAADRKCYPRILPYLTP